MNAKERLFAYLAGEEVDRIPNLNLIMQFGAQYTGVPFSKYLKDYRYLVDAEIKVARDFDIDCVCAISDSYREAEGFGLKVRYPEDDLSVAEGSLILEHNDVKKLKIVNPYEADRMNDRLLAIESLKNQVGDEYPVIGWVEGPIAEASDLRGLNEFMFDLIDSPSFAMELMDICLENAINFAKEQIKSGANIVGVGDAAASLIGPQLYMEYVFPRENKLFDAIHEMGAKAKLHICGDISNIVEYIAQSGADIVDVDHMVDLAMVVESLGEGQMANGNYDPVGILLNGSVNDVQSAIENCINQMGERRAIISAGCEVPRHTPITNMRRVANILKEKSNV